MGRGTMRSDDGVIRHTYFPKPKAKAYLENFEIDEEEDWLSCFEVGRDEDGNLKSYTEFTPNPLNAKYVKRNDKCSINYKLQSVTNANLKWRDLPSMEWHAYCERLSKLQQKSIGTPRVANWTMFYVYSFDETLKELMKMEYLHDDRDVFIDYSWERALLIKEDVYSKWCLEFFSTMYFERGVDRTKLMTKKCVWFRLCGQEHVPTLPKFMVHSGLYDPKDSDANWDKLKDVTHSGSTYASHYVTKIAKSLWYLVNKEVEKYLKPIECEKWTTKMLANELDLENYRLLRPTLSPPPTRVAREQRQEPRGSSRAMQDEDDDDTLMSKQRVQTDDDIGSEED
ncbi:hypothetical protein Tco_1360430 [Tanacetum coccineum]